MKVIHCESKTKIINKRTGHVYASEAEAKFDINDQMSATTEEEIQRDVTIIVPQLDIEGGTD
jgi:hypothetical protein